MIFKCKSANICCYTVLGRKQKGIVGSQQDENFAAINMQEAEELQDWIENRVSNRQTNLDDIQELVY
jgi:hypothetical protein